MNTATQARVQHIYELARLDRVPERPCSGAVVARQALRTGNGSPVATGVRGERVEVALIRQPRGTGNDVHTDPAEQFLYVMEGALEVDIDGQRLRVPAGHVVHLPADMPHAHHAVDADALVYLARDARYPLAETPQGSAYAAGAGDAPRTRNVTGRQVRYVYEIAKLDAVPEGDNSAKVTPNNFISKKSSSFGAALTGVRLHVGRIHKGVGSGTKLHTHPNEQFSYVLEGTMLYEIDGNDDVAPPGSVTHLPPGIRHSALASAAGDVVTFVAKDTSHGMSGPPVDGIEDGPIYLPGFGPRPAAK